MFVVKQGDGEKIFDGEFSRKFSVAFDDRYLKGVTGLRIDIESEDANAKDTNRPIFDCDFYRGANRIPRG